MTELKHPDDLAGFQNIVTGYIQPGDRITFPWDTPTGRAVEEAVPLLIGIPVEHAEIMDLRVYRKMAVAHQGDLDHIKIKTSGEPGYINLCVTSSTLPSNASERKRVPIATGVIDYFPDALAAIAQVSLAGNEQHNPGTPLHWDRSKSGDESDALMRHFLERGKLDTDGLSHTAKMAWRALACLQKEIESRRG